MMLRLGQLSRAHLLSGSLRTNAQGSSNQLRLFTEDLEGGAAGSKDVRRRSPLREAITREEWEQPWKPDFDEMPFTAGEPRVPLHVQIQQEMDVAHKAAERVDAYKYKVDVLNLDDSKSKRKLSAKDKKLDADMKDVIKHMIGGLSPEHVNKLKDEPEYATFEPQAFVTKLFSNEYELKDPQQRRSLYMDCELLPNETYLATQYKEPEPVPWDPMILIDLKQKYETGKLDNEELSQLILEALAKGQVSQEQLEEHCLLRPAKNPEENIGIGALIPTSLESDDEQETLDPVSDSDEDSDAEEKLLNDAYLRTLEKADEQIVTLNEEDLASDDDDDDDDGQRRRKKKATTTTTNQKKKTTTTTKSLFDLLDNDEPLRRPIRSKRMSALKPTQRAMDNAERMGVKFIPDRRESHALSDSDLSDSDYYDDDQFEWEQRSDDEVGEASVMVMRQLEFEDEETQEMLNHLLTMDFDEPLPRNMTYNVDDDDEAEAEAEEDARLAAFAKTEELEAVRQNLVRAANEESEDESAVYDDSGMLRAAPWKFDAIDPDGRQREAMRRTMALVSSLSPEDHRMVTTEGFEELVSSDDEEQKPAWETEYSEENPYADDKVAQGRLNDQLDNGEITDLNECVLDVDMDQAKLFASSLDEEGGTDGPIVAYTEAMQMATGGRRPILKDATKEALYEAHLSDPDAWTVARLSQRYGLRQSRVRAIIRQKQIEKQAEREHPELLSPQLQASIELECEAVDDFHDVELAEDEVVDLRPAAPHGPTFGFIDGAADRKKAAQAYWRGAKKMRRQWIPREQIPRTPTPNTPPPEVLDPGLIAGFAPPKRRVVYANWNPDVHPLEEFVLVREPDGTIRTPNFEERVQWLFMPMFNLLPESYRRPENAAKIDAPVIGPEWDGTPGDYIGARGDHAETQDTLRAYSELSKSHGMYLDEAIQQIIDGPDVNNRRRQTELASQTLQNGDVPTDSFRRTTTTTTTTTGARGPSFASRLDPDAQADDVDELAKGNGNDYDDDIAYALDDETQEFLEQMHKKQTLEELQAEHDSLDSAIDADGFAVDDLIPELDLMHGIKNKGFVNWDKHFSERVANDPHRDSPRGGPPPLPSWMQKKE